MNDIRLAWISRFIDDEAARMRIAQRFFLNRNDSWKRDYGTSDATAEESNADETLVGDNKVRGRRG